MRSGFTVHSHMHKITGVGSGLKAAGKVRKPANQPSLILKGRQELALGWA